MIATFQSITPIFLVMILGMFLRRLPLFDDGFWTGLDKLGFFVLYPFLLFTTVLQADFGALSLGIVLTATMTAWSAIAVFVLALWPLLKKLGVSGPTFSTVFQSSVRWNGFVALAIAQKLFPAEGVAMVGLLMAVIVIPINVTCVAVLVYFGAGERRVSAIGLKMLANPMIVGVAAALILRQLPFVLPQPLLEGISLLARAAIGMGLLAIGAGLHLSALLQPRPVVFLPLALKLIAYPLLVIALAVSFGLNSEQTVWLSLCACVPTAMNGYVLARQMGGDAPTYALAATLQTAAAFITIPLMLALAAFVSG